jgi:phage tail-like protein
MKTKTEPPPSWDKIVQLLPSVFRRAIVENSPLAALTIVMAHYVDPVDKAAGELDGYFNPWRCPERFLPLLATWMDIPLPITTGSQRLRELIAVAVGLHQVRGTRRALLAFLEAATGMQGFEINETVRDGEGKLRPFVVVVRAPGAVRDHAAMIARIIDSERPAHVRCELEFMP